MKRILGILLVMCLFIVGCSKEDSSSYNKYIEEGKTAIANKEYEKGRNFFSLALEEKPDEEEAKRLYNQINNLIEAVDSKDNKKYDVAIQLCDVTLNIDSDSNLVRDIAKDLKQECEKLKSQAKKDEETKKSEEVKKVQNDTSVTQNIRSDFKQKSIEAEQVLVKSSGFLRYNDILINTLRSYNINDIESAKVVYELSDELLNNLYQGIKAEGYEGFDTIKEEQVAWVKDKMKQEKSLSNDELIKYQTLVNLTLDRCDDLNRYSYYGY